MTSKLDHSAERCPMESADSTVQNIVHSKIARALDRAVLPPDFQVPFSPRLIYCMISSLETRAGSYVVLNSKAWSTFVGHPETLQCFDPATRRAGVLSGHLGSLLGAEVYSDCYYSAEERILPEDCVRMYVMSADGSEGYSVNLT
jgi:hypothetical protein